MQSSIVSIFYYLNYLTHRQFPDMEHNESDMPILRIVTTPRVAVALLTCTVGAYSIGTIEATLSQFLEMQLGLSVQKIALAFLVMSLCSVLATPGQILTRHNGSK